MKKGFTLVELMAVLVLIVLISTIGYAGITAVQNNIDKNLWEGKVEAIETGAADYGEDNKNRLNGTCNIDGVNKSNCLTRTVQFLIDNSYVDTDEVDSSDNKVIINDTLKEDDPNYYANNMEVFIYLENNRVYAKLNQPES